MPKWNRAYDSGRKYKKEWELKFPWIRKASGRSNSENAFCNVCHAELGPRLAHLNRHEAALKHKQRIPSTSQGKLQTRSATTVRSTPAIMASKSFLNLQGKAVIITGASAGIGEAIAIEFARQGCKLMLCGRDKQRLDSVVAKCKEEAEGLEIVVKTTCGDITDSDVQKKIVDNTVSAFGCIDVLVNNAGMNIPRDPFTTTPDDYHQIMKTNMESVFFLSQLAVPHLKNSKGNIVNVSSIASLMPMSKSVVYSMSKAALDSYTKSLAIELAPFGVRVNSVNPGSVVTMLYRRGPEAMSDEKYDQFKKNQTTSHIHPLGRMVQASEVADSAVFLASERASFLTGQIIFVDGGRHCLGPQPKFQL